MDQYIALFLIKGIIVGSIYALIALGFNAIYNTTGVVNFAQGEFLMVGGIAAAWALSALSLPLALAIAFGLSAGAMTGLLVYTLAIRPVRASPVTCIIITIGVSIVLRALAALVWGTDPYHLPSLIEGDVTLAGAAIDYHSLAIVAVSGFCMLLLWLFYRVSRTGKAMRACADNMDAARLCGVSPKRMSASAFSISALLGAVGGVMVTPILSMSFDRGTMLGLKGFAAAILGGLANPVGCVVGGLAIGVLEQYACLISSVYRDILSLGVVVLVLLVRPRGLLGK